MDARARQEMIDDLLANEDLDRYKDILLRLLEMLTHEQLVAIYREYVG